MGCTQVVREKVVCAKLIGKYVISTLVSLDNIEFHLALRLT